MIARSAWLPAIGVFASAARHQNFAHAAEELHLTASAVSHHVRKLEALLGVTLFKRHARGVEVTPEGRVLADAAGVALGDIDSALASLRRSRTVARVRITTMPSFAASWLVPRLVRFAAAHPDVRISLDTERALARFEEGGLDLGVRYGPGQWTGLSARRLMGDALFPAAAPTLPGVADAREPADVARLPLISDLGLEGWRDWFRAAGLRGLRIAEMHTFSDSTDALTAASTGLGAVLARRGLSVPYLASGRLVALPGPALKARYAYYIVHPQHRRLSSAATRFVDWLEQEGVREDAAVDAAPAAARARRAR